MYLCNCIFLGVYRGVSDSHLTSPTTLIVKWIGWIREDENRGGRKFFTNLKIPL